MITLEEIEAIEAKAKGRMEKEKDRYAANMPALIDWMTNEEKEILHEWRMQQPTYKEMRDEAKEKIRQRLLVRKQKHLTRNK